MALNTAAALFSLRGLTALFDAGVAAAAPFYPRLCSIQPSDGADEEYAKLGAIPSVRKWTGERKAKKLRGASFTLPNEPWEVTVEVEKDDIADDRLGAYSLLMQQVGARAAQHPDKLLFERMVAGSGAECFDGQYFFDTDHSWGSSGAQANLIDHTVVDEDAPTAAEFKGAYEAAVRQMLGFVDDAGEPLNQPVVSEQNSLMVITPISLRSTAYQALTASLLGGGDSNVIVDRPQIYSSPFLSDAKAFYVFDVGDAVKPFVFQDREPLSRQWSGDLSVIKEKHVWLMTKRRYAIGYLAWWKAVKVTISE